MTAVSELQPKTTARRGLTVRDQPVWAAVAFGLLLMQIAWIFALPPFRGIDEFDHSYRAAAVVRGELAPPPTNATRGTGATLTVPRDIVEAAEAECRRLPYTKDADCAGEPDGDMRRVASGAGRYNPTYYLFLGIPTTFLEGTAALYGMRVFSATLAWFVFVLAIAALRTWGPGRWPAIALSVATTPVLVYSSTLASPNGLELVSGMALWTALIGLTVAPDPRHDTRLLAIAAVTGTLLVTVRSLGPLWCLLILASVLLAQRPSRGRLKELLSRRLTQVGAAVVLVATLANVAWVVQMDSLVIGKLRMHEYSSVEKVGIVVVACFGWMFQTIAAFPLRNDDAPPVVYACFFVVFGWLFARGLANARRAQRVGIVMTAGLAFLIPAVITYRTFEEYGVSWQGRYTMPYSVGVALLAGLALLTAGRKPRAPVLLALGIAYAVAQAVSMLALNDLERRESPGVGSGDWILVNPGILGAISVVGALCLWAGASGLRWSRRAQPGPG